MNICTSQIIQQVFLIRMQPKQDMPISEENDNSSNNFRPYKNEKSTLEAKDIEKNHIDWISKSSATKKHAKDSLSVYISQDGLLRSELLSSLKKIRFN